MNSVFHLYNGNFYVWGNIVLVKSSYYGMAYVMYNEIKLNIGIKEKVISGLL